MFVCPILSYSLYICMPPDTPTCSNTPICPQCSPMHLYVVGCICMWYGDALGSHMLDNHLRGSGCLHICPTPPCIVCSLYLCIIYGISACSMGKTLLMLGSGVLACLSGFWCLSVHTFDVHYASSYAFCSLLCLKLLLQQLQLLLLQ